MKQAFMSLTGYLLLGLLLSACSPREALQAQAQEATRQQEPLPAVLQKAEGYHIETDGGFQLIKRIPEQAELPAMQAIVSGCVRIDHGQESYMADTLMVSRQQTGEMIQGIPLKYEFAEAEHAPLPLSGDPDVDLQLVDANFDGFLDIQLLRSFGGTYNDFYRFFLWVPERNAFYPGEELDALFLCYPEFDVQARTITAWEKDGSFWEESIFRYMDGLPVLAEQTTEEYDYVFERRRDLVKKLVNGDLLLSEVLYSPEFPTEVPEDEGYYFSDSPHSFGVLKMLPAQDNMPSMAMLLCGREGARDYEVLTLEILDMDQHTVRQLFVLPTIERLHTDGLRLNGPEAVDRDILCKDFNADGYPDFAFTHSPEASQLRWLWDAQTEEFQLQDVSP